MDRIPKQSKLCLKLDSKLNRSVVYTSFINAFPIHFSVQFSARTSALQFYYDSSNMLIRNRKVTVNMYRALENCSFANMFLNTNSYENDKNDVRCEFLGTNPKYEKYIVQFLGESLSLRIQQSNNKHSFDNCLNVYGWKLLDADTTYAFYFVERRFPNFVTKKNMIRTCAIQFATKEGLSTLDSYVESKKTSIRKLNKNDYPDFIQNISSSLDSEGSE